MISTKSARTLSFSAFYGSIEAPRRDELVATLTFPENAREGPQKAAESGLNPARVTRKQVPGRLLGPEGLR